MEEKDGGGGTRATTATPPHSKRRGNSAKRNTPSFEGRERGHEARQGGRGAHEIALKEKVGGVMGSKIKKVKLQEPDSFADHKDLKGNAFKVGGSVLASDMRKSLKWSDLGLGDV
eukprot:Hpha_TRINITY_DN16007_c5_g2::TRINITY_DN16007_c5_g2_i1::g.117664::m.117664